MNGMTEVKVSDLTGYALDYAVEIAISGIKPTAKHAFAWQYQNEARKDYSTCWIDGGPLIERFGVMLIDPGEDGEWEASTSGDTEFCSGETPLIATCRAIIAAKLGETVSLPSRLFQ